jgi:hypothetical protein
MNSRITASALLNRSIAVLERGSGEGVSEALEAVSSAGAMAGTAAGDGLDAEGAITEAIFTGFASCSTFRGSGREARLALK